MIKYFFAAILFGACTVNNLTNQTVSKANVADSAALLRLEENIKAANLAIRVSLPDTVHSFSKEIKLKLVLTNNSNESYLVSNPAHWINSFVTILHNGQDVPTILVRVNPSLKFDFIPLNAHDSSTVNFDYDLDELVHPDMVDKGRYTIFFDYYGKVKTADGQSELKDIQLKSNAKEFFIQ